MDIDKDRSEDVSEESEDNKNNTEDIKVLKVCNSQSSLSFRQYFTLPPLYHGSPVDSIGLQ